MFIVISEAENGVLVSYHEDGQEAMPAHATKSFPCLAEAIASIKYPTKFQLPAADADGDVVLVGRTV